MKLAAITVHFDHPELTERLIGRLSTYDIISNIVVVLHDDSYSPSEDLRVKYLIEENRGYAAGLNLAVRHLIETSSDTDLVLALNPDIKIEESQLLDLLDKHITSGAVVTFPSLVEEGRVLHGFRFGWIGTMKPGEEFFSGACFLFSVEAWKQVSGFNEKYFHYYEDADFCLRLRNAGLPIHHASEILVEHQSKSGVDYPDTVLPYYAVRNHLLFLKELGKLNPISFSNVALRQLLYLFRWKAGWRGVPQWFRGVRDFKKQF